MIIVAMFMQRSYLSIVFKLQDGLSSGLHVFAQLKTEVYLMIYLYHYQTET